MKRRAVVLASVALWVAATSSEAALQVTLLPVADIPSNGTGFVEVMVTADVDTEVAAFGFELGIDMPYLTDSLLEFVEPRLPYENDANYVFFGATSGPLGDTAGSTPPTMWFGSDLADLASLGVVELLANETYLLARVALQHSSNPDFDEAGNQFAINVVPGFNTYFLDMNFADITGVDLAAATSTATIVASAAAPVPEPSSLLLLGGLALTALPWCRRRRFW